MVTTSSGASTTTNAATIPSHQEELSLSDLATWTSDSHCVYHGHCLNFRLGLAHDGNCVLFDSTDVTLMRGSVTALVGTNGSGKTSLAKVLCSKQLPGFPSNLSIHYVSSHEHHHSTTSNPRKKDEDDAGVDEGDNDDIDGDDLQTLTPLEFLHKVVDDQVSCVEEQITDLESQLEDVGSDEDEIERITDQLSNLYDVQSQLEESKHGMEATLQTLGFQPHLSKTVNQLSSGWAYKLHLIASFASQSDIFIVDEPSFLDAPSMEWFTSQLLEKATKQNAMVLLISHKEHLLRQVCGFDNSNIWYINAANQTLTQYHNGYDSFLIAKEAQASKASKTLTAMEDKVQGATRSLTHVKQQLQKRERNMNAKSAASAIDKRFIKGKNKEAKQKADKSAASKLKQLKKDVASNEDILKRQAIVDRDQPLEIVGSIGDGTLVTFQEVYFGYTSSDDEIFRDLDLRLESTDRILLRGPNGCGKSTLVELILGRKHVAEGSISSKLGKRVLYFPQTALRELTTYHSNETALQYLTSGGNGNKDHNNHQIMLTQTEARIQLGKFGLTKGVALRTIGSLSTGQRIRLWLSKHCLHNDNPDTTAPYLLIMDEISENLDIQTRDSLLKILNTFEGAVILVSHDHDFSLRFQPTQIWTIQNKTIISTFP